MRFEGIKKVLDGHFINRYDITYTTEDNRTKVYEIISRNDNVSSLADLHNDRPDGVVIVATDIDGGKILINKEYRMSVGDYVYNFPAGLIACGTKRTYCRCFQRVELHCRPQYCIHSETGSRY